MQIKNYKKVYVFDDMDEYQDGWEEDGDELVMVGGKNWNVYIAKQNDAAYDDFLVDVSLVFFESRADFDAFMAMRSDVIDVETDNTQAGSAVHYYAALIPTEEE